jgi:hypothetical protein
MFDVVVGLLSAGLLSFAVWLFVIEPRGKVHDREI